MSFGSSKQKSSSNSQQTSQSSSTNQAYPFLQTALGGTVGNVSQGSSAIANLLGLNGSASSQDGFNNFRNNSGYNFVENEGIKNLTAQNAYKGLLNSGSALKGIVDYSQNLGSTYLDKYLSQLTGYTNIGQQAASTLAGAGQTSSSTSQGTSTSTGKGNSTNFSLG